MTESALKTHSITVGLKLKRQMIKSVLVSQFSSIVRVFCKKKVDFFPCHFWFEIYKGNYKIYKGKLGLGVFHCWPLKTILGIVQLGGLHYWGPNASLDTHIDIIMMSIGIRHISYMPYMTKMMLWQIAYDSHTYFNMGV